MKPRIILAGILFCLYTVLSAGLLMAEQPLTKISESIYSYVGVPASTEGNAFSANAGIIIGTDSVMVIDTLTSAKEAKTFLKAIKKITDKPIRYVVNTHYHLDHALGNCVFADEGATIISHETCKAAILHSGEQTLKDPAMFGLTPDFWEGTTVEPPSITFKKEMAIDLGNLTVNLIHSGVRSHSAGSIIIHIPKEDVVFTGDILFTDFHPFLAEGDLDGWQKTLDNITKMGVSKIIPGHGPLSTNKDIQAMKSYLKIFDENAKLLAADITDPKVLTAKMLEVLPHRNGGEFIIPMNLGMRYMAKPEAKK